MSRSRSIVRFSAVALAAAITLAPNAASADPGSPITVVGGGQSTQRDTIGLLVGSPHVVVYDLWETFAADVGPYGGVQDTFPHELMAQSADGSQHDLGPLTQADSQLSIWSLSGTTLTAIDRADRTTVDWWNVATGSHGTITIPSRTYVSAGPHGVLYMTKNGSLKLETIGGVTTSLGRPFKARPRVPDAVVNSKAVLLSDDFGHARYLTFADPTKVHDVGRGGTIVCSDMSSRYAACTTAGIRGGRPTRAELIPLDGSKPMKANDKRENFGRVGLAGRSTLVWTRFGKKHGGNIVLASRKVGAHKTKYGAQPVEFGVVASAFGKALTVSNGFHRILATTTAPKLKPLILAPKSPVTAAGFSLTAGHLVDIDDAVDPGKGAPVAVRTRTLTASVGGEVVGAPTVVGRADTKHYLPIAGVTAADSAYAYETNEPDYTQDLHVVAGGHAKVIHRVWGAISLSYPWVSYERRGQNLDTVHVRDLATGTDKVYATVGDFVARDAVIDGSDLDFAAKNGSIHRVDLTTGTQTKLAPAAASGFEQFRIYASGGRVGWEIQYGGDSNRTFVDTIRDSNGTMIPLNLRLIGMSSDGALLSSERVDGFQLGPRSVPTTISLRAWNGTVTQVLPDAPYADVQEQDGVVAWLTNFGVLNVAALS